MTDFEEAMESPTYELTYDQYIDTESLIDYFLITEVTKHIDAFKLSFYMYKEKDSDGGKLKMGPLWDINLGYGNFDFGCDASPVGWIYPCTAAAFWVEKIIEIPEVEDQVFCRWQQLREAELSTENLVGRVDSLVEHIGPAAQRNFELYDVLGNYVWPNSFVGDTYEEEVEFLRDWLEIRLDWMDLNMLGNAESNCSEILSDPEIDSARKLTAFPNPATDLIYFTHPVGADENGQLTVFDMTGKLVLTAVVSKNKAVDISMLDSGIYSYEYRENSDQVLRGKFIKN
jgi:hypothetical protein